MRNKKYRTILNYVLPVVVVLTLLTGGLFESIFVLTAYLIYRYYTERDKVHSYFGKRNYLKGKVSKSIERYEKAYLTKMAEGKVKVSYAYALLLKNQIEKAEKILEEVRETERMEKVESAFVVCEAVLKWRKTQDIKTAITLLETTANDLKNSTYYAILGRLYLLSKQIAHAKRVNQEGYDYNKDHSLILENVLYVLCYEKKFGEALEIAEKLIGSAPFTPDAFYLAGVVFEENSDRQKAQKMYQRAIDHEYTIMSLTTLEDLEKKL